MRIGWIANGKSKHTKRWTSELAAIGNDVFLLHLGKTTKDDLSDYPEYNNVTFMNIVQPFGANHLTRMVRYGIRKIMGDTPFNKRLAKKIDTIAKENDFDVIVVHGMQFHGQVSGYLKNVPLVIILAGSDIYQRKKDPQTTMEYQQAFARADIIEAQSMAIIKKAREDFHFNRNKIKVLPWGIDFKRYPFDRINAQIPYMKEKLHIPEDKFVILSCRSMRAIYNWENILHAMPLVDDLDIHLVMIRGLGSDADLQKAQDIISDLKLKDKVTIVPEFVPFDKMATLYAIADASISIPSSDNLSDVIWEMMAFRSIPILARIPAYFEALDEKHAIYLSDRSPASIAKGIRHAYNIEQSQSLLEENYHKVSENTWEKTLQKQMEILNEAIERFKSHS